MSSAAEIHPGTGHKRSHMSSAAEIHPGTGHKRSHMSSAAESHPGSIEPVLIHSNPSRPQRSLQHIPKGPTNLQLQAIAQVQDETPQQIIPPLGDSPFHIDIPKSDGPSTNQNP